MTLALAPACPPDDATAPNCAHLLARGYEPLAALCEPLHLDVRWLTEAPTPTPGTAYRFAEHNGDRIEADAPSGVATHRPVLEQLATEPNVLAAFLDAEEVRAATPSRRALHGCLWSVSLLLSRVWYLERRVPLLDQRAVRCDLSSNRYEVTPGGFRCLPDDPAAGLPGLRTVPDEEALRAELRDAFAALVGPLLAAIGPWSRRGPRALWGMAGGDLVSGIWTLGRLLGEEERGARLAGEVLPHAIAPYPDGAGFRHLTGATGRRHLTRTRTGCCLYYAIRPAEACGTCPRTGDAERLRRLEG